jgi:S1-C subfamily serine protease
VAIVGYPQDGPFDVQTGRIRAEQNLRSPDIYGGGTVVREVYSIRGLVRPGNSGGPIVTPDGRVAGVVFAASVTDPETGYALTSEQVSDRARRSAPASARPEALGTAAPRGAAY